MNLAEIEQFEHQVRPMKLSEAIRIGAKIRPQCRGLFFRDGKSCALGAAHEAITGKKSINVGWFRSQFGVTDLILAEITTRNDSGESRESIADWLQERGL